MKDNNLLHKIIGFSSDNVNTVASTINGVSGKLK